MNQKDFIKLFWNHYLDLETEVINCLKYIELDINHFGVYSSKFVKIMLECGSEIDNVFRTLCNIGRDLRTTISNYYFPILSKFPDLLSQTVSIKSTDISFQPFNTWTNDRASQSLQWWESYNSVKHDRINNFTSATLKNTLSLLSALFILEMLSYDDLYNNDTNAYCNIPDNHSDFFILKGHTIKIRNDRIENGVEYKVLVE